MPYTRANVYFDIETAPASRAVLGIVKPFDEDKPDLGRLTSQKSIDAKVKDFEENKDRYRDEHFAKVEEKAALDPLTGRVVAIAAKVVTTDRDPNVVTFVGEDEFDNINRFLNLLNDVTHNYNETRVIGYNSKSFDFPFLQTRSLVNNLYYRPLDDRGYLTANNHDVALHWTCGQYGKFPPKFKVLCDLFGISCKSQGIHGGQWYDTYLEDEPAALAYCKEEVNALHLLCDRLYYHRLEEF